MKHDIRDLIAEAFYVFASITTFACIGLMLAWRG